MHRTSCHSVQHELDLFESSRTTRNLVRRSGRPDPPFVFSFRSRLALKRPQRHNITAKSIGSTLVTTLRGNLFGKAQKDGPFLSDGHLCPEQLAAVGRY